MSRFSSVQLPLFDPPGGTAVVVCATEDFRTVDGPMAERGVLTLAAESWDAADPDQGGRPDKHPRRLAGFWVMGVSPSRSRHDPHRAGTAAGGTGMFETGEA
ncbi:MULTISPECIES: hypothetical protein [unclassified Streptomyces]|uniref:hypothetical protein n=1 Tax=unclassified Streptomyces TaxID=2593676 RepID=UPI0035E38921